MAKRKEEFEFDEQELVAEFMKEHLRCGHCDVYIAKSCFKFMDAISIVPKKEI